MISRVVCGLALLLRQVRSTKAYETRVQRPKALRDIEIMAEAIIKVKFYNVHEMPQNL